MLTNKVIQRFNVIMVLNSIEFLVLLQRAFQKENIGKHVNVASEYEAIGPIDFGIEIVRSPGVLNTNNINILSFDCVQEAFMIGLIGSSEYRCE
jgi:hypothetical protein